MVRVTMCPASRRRCVDQAGEFAVLVRMGAVVVVEADQEIGEVGAVLDADARDELLRGDALAAGRAA
jgi:hypothetical protein